MAKKDPKVGTGKKPKGSGRRLYTDENPRDTVRIKFATPTDARATVAKVKRINKPFARKKAAAGGMQKYIGRSIRGEYGGVNLSNPSYVKYYKGMLD